MKAVRATRILGAAFLFQAVTSLISGLIQKIGIDRGTIDETMTHLAAAPWLMYANILGEVVTALGIIFLGAVLYVYLREQNEIWALTGMGFYILEGVMLAASRLDAFSLLRISQAYAATGHPSDLLTLGSLAFDRMTLGFSGFAMLAFCLGAIPLYFLLDKSRMAPRVLSLWGLIAVFPCLVGTLLTFFGIHPPFFIYLPYAPFEFVIGLWILIKGIQSRIETAGSPAVLVGGNA